METGVTTACEQWAYKQLLTKLVKIFYCALGASKAHVIDYTGVCN